MDFRRLRTFVHEAELGSITKAAEKLGYSQPTVSFQIKQLETDLGVKLFERIGHTVQLTANGRHALTYAQSICHLSDEMAQGSQNLNQMQGQVTLGMPDSLCIPLVSNHFARFRKEYPNIAVTVCTAGTNDLYRMLDRNEVDFVVTLDSHLYKPAYVIAHEEKLNASFICSPRHPLAGEKKVAISQLLKEPFLLTEKGMSYRRLMEEQLAKDSMEIDPILEIGSADMICKLVAQDLGLSFLPDFVTEDAVRQGQIVRLPVADFGIDLWQQLVYHRDKWMSYPMEAAINDLAANLFHAE